MSRLCSGRIAAWLMAAALLPSLLYFGHWSFDFPLPDGYHARIGLQEAPHAGDEETAHGEHCHGEASCSDVQPLGISPFAVMGRALALLGAAGVMFAVSARALLLRPGAVVLPEPMPPRPLSLNG